MQSARLTLQRSRCTELRVWQQQLTSWLFFEKTPPLGCVVLFASRRVPLAARRRFRVLPCSARDPQRAYASHVPAQISDATSVPVALNLRACDPSKSAWTKVPPAHNKQTACHPKKLAQHQGDCGPQGSGSA